jgi:hypothetical protein
MIRFPTQSVPHLAAQCFTFGGCWVQISARRPVVLTEDFMALLNLSMEMAGYVSHCAANILHVDARLTGSVFKQIRVNKNRLVSVINDDQRRPICCKSYTKLENALQKYMCTRKDYSISTSFSANSYEPW